MPEGQRHLTHEERCQIGALKESGLSDGAIAARPGRDRSSVWRELRRNGGDSGYSPGEAQGRAEARRGAASPNPRKMTPDRWAHVEGLLAEGRSPEQVAGRLRLEGGWTVGRQWTSEHVRADGKAGGDLFLLLRRRGKKPNWRGGRRSGRGHIPGRVDISGRPEEVGSRERVGDWEADTIIGRGHSGAVVSLVDRASKFVFLQRVERRTSYVQRIRNERRMWLWKNLARFPVQNMSVAFRRPSGSFLWRDRRRRTTSGGGGAGSCPAGRVGPIGPWIATADPSGSVVGPPSRPSPGSWMDAWVSEPDHRGARSGRA